MRTQRRNTYAAGGALLLAGMLALTACGTDDNSGGGSGGSSANAASSSNCAKGTLNTSGSTAQANAMSEWIKAYQGTCSDATVNYQANGSGTGIEQFNQGSTSFAGSDSPLKPEEKTAAQQRCKGNDVIQLPMVIGPISVVYNLDGVTNLKMTPTVLAGIFSGKVKKWNDPAIKKINAGAKLPSTAIQTFHRSDESGTTDNFTKYLAGTAAKAWTYDHDKAWRAPGGQGVKGSDQIAAAIQKTSGAISYVEYSYAQNSKLSQAKVQNKSGKFVTLTDTSAAATVGSAKVVGKGLDRELSIDYNTTEATAYPIVLATYEITCQKGLAEDQAKLVKGFLTYASSAAGQKSLSSLGYAPLPDNIAAKVRTSVKSIA